MKKTVAIGLAILFGAACGVGTTCAVYETAKYKAEQEQGAPEVALKDGAVVTAGAGLTVTKISAENYAAEGVTENVDSAYTLTANVNEDAFNKRVKWSVAWKDAESEWATGKTVTDYVTITPSEEGSLTATATCLKDFGEQIIITVASEVDESVNATCTVDYAKKIKSMDFLLDKSNNWENYTAIRMENNVIFVGYAGATAIKESYESNQKSTGVIVPSSVTHTAYTIDDSFSLEWQMKVDGILAGDLPLIEGATDWFTYQTDPYLRVYPAPLTYAVAYQRHTKGNIVKQYSCLYGATIEGCAYGPLGQAYQKEIERASGRKGVMYIRTVSTGSYSTFYSDEMEVYMDLSQVPVVSLALDQTGLIF